MISLFGGLSVRTKAPVANLNGNQKHATYLSSSGAIVKWLSYQNIEIRFCTYMVNPFSVGVCLCVRVISFDYRMIGIAGLRVELWLFKVF